MWPFTKKQPEKDSFLAEFLQALQASEMPEEVKTEVRLKLIEIKDRFRAEIEKWRKEAENKRPASPYIPNDQNRAQAILNSLSWMMERLMPIFEKYNMNPTRSHKFSKVCYALISRYV